MLFMENVMKWLVGVLEDYVILLKRRRKFFEIIVMSDSGDLDFEKLDFGEFNFLFKGDLLKLGSFVIEDVLFNEIV